jgi:MFS family permease
VKTGRFFAPFSSPHFRIFAFSQTISQFGDKVNHRALIFIVGLFAADSPVAMAQLAVALTLPVLIFGPLAGVFVDRWSRKRVLVVCEAGRGLLLLLLPVVVVSSSTLWTVYPLVFVIALLILFLNTAKGSALPNLVPSDLLHEANSAVALLARVASVAGFFLADVLVIRPHWLGLSLSGWAGSFVLAGAAFLLSAVALSTLKLSFRRSGDPGSWSGRGRSVSSAFGDAAAEAAEGFCLLRRSRRVGMTMGSVVLFTLVGAAIYVLGVPIVQQELHHGALSIGTLTAVMGIGTIVGSFLFGAYGNRFRKSSVVVVGFFLAGVLMIVFSWLESFPAACGVIAVGGIILAPILITQNTVLHECLPEEQRGRIFGLKEWVFNGCLAACAGTLGLVARFSPPRPTLRAVGALILLLALVALVVRNRTDRRRERDVDNPNGHML